jgi:hypothetical protein
MCPACITTLALIFAGATSAGGMTALVARKLRADAGVRIPQQPVSKERPS